jgi:hypothetical protein
MRQRDTTDLRISRALTSYTDDILPSVSCKSRIMEEIREKESAMRQNQEAAVNRRTIRRPGAMRFGKAAGIAAVLTIACAGTVIAGGMIGSTKGSSHSGYDYKSYSAMDQAWQDAGLSADLPEAFSNGCRFQGATLVSVEDQSGTGETTGESKEIAVTYASGDEEVSVTVSGKKDDAENPTDVVTLPGGTELFYSSDTYRFLPDEEEGKPLSEADQSFESEPHHYISYGEGNSESTEVIDSVNVTEGDVTYSLQCDHSDTSKDSLLSMAEEIVND